MPKVTVDITPALLTLTPTGVVGRDDIIALIKSHYPTLGSRSTLWDFTGADVGGLTREDLDAIAATARATLPPSATRKTAYVVGDQTAYLKACKYLNAAVIAGLPAEYAVFTSLNAAHEWLARP